MSLPGRVRLHGMQLYYHPHSPYSHKVMIAFAEKRYAHELHSFERYKHVAAYFARAVERPSVKGVFDEVAPYFAKSA